MSFKDRITRSSLYKILKYLKITRVLLFIIEQINNILRPILQYKELKEGEHKLKKVYKHTVALFETWKKSQYKGINLKKRSHSIVISLTSYPARIPTIHLCIASLLSQHLKPDKILLWLAEDEFEHTQIQSEYISLLEEFGLTVEWIPKQMKAFAKLVPALKKYQNSIIVTVDDDKIYHPDMLSSLFHEHQKYPNCIIAHNGLYLQKTAHNQIADFYTLTEFFNTHILSDTFRQHCASPNHNVFVQGHFGVLYPPRVLPINETCDVDTFQKLTPMADDIWFNAIAILHKIPRLILASPLIPESITSKEVQKNALFKTNLLQNQNDVQIKKVFDYFNIYEYLH